MPKKKSKRGRPRKPEGQRKQWKSAGFKLDGDHYALLETGCEMTGISRAEGMRRAIRLWVESIQGGSSHGHATETGSDVPPGGAGGNRASHSEGAGAASEGQHDGETKAGKTCKRCEGKCFVRWDWSAAGPNAGPLSGAEVPCDANAKLARKCPSCGGQGYFPVRTVEVAHR